MSTAELIEESISEEDATEAAEYVLGLSGAEDRRRFEARMAALPALQSEVAAWDEDLVILTQDIPERTVPDTVERDLNLRLFGVPETPKETGPEPRDQSTTFWKWFSGAALAIAVAALLFIIGERQAAPVSDTQGGAGAEQAAE